MHVCTAVYTHVHTHACAIRLCFGLCTRSPNRRKIMLALPCPRPGLDAVPGPRPNHKKKKGFDTHFDTNVDTNVKNTCQRTCPNTRRRTRQRACRRTCPRTCPRTCQQVNKPKEVAINYLKTWFTIDLLSSIPFDWFLAVRL